MTRVEPADALLVVDVGNSRVGLGVWDGDGVHDVQRIGAGAPDGDFEAAAKTACAALRAGQRAIVLASVNPTLAMRVQTVLEDIAGQDVLRVRDDLPLPMAAELDNLDDVGVDRLCAAAAAYERVGTTCAVAACGTALTVDCVSADGRFLGGSILPGMQMSCDALHTGTAQLPRVLAGAPVSVFGRNTHDAIINGVAFGVVGALRETVERYATELREWPHLVLTGGNAPLLAELADFVDAVVPDLCLMGVALTYRMAAGQT